MEYVVWFVSAVNLWFGLRCFLNVIGVLRTSKYAKGTTVLFAVLFLAFGVCGFVFGTPDDGYRLGLLCSTGPWALAIAVMFLVLITGRQQ